MSNYSKIHRGACRHRLEANPLERRLADLWQEWNEKQFTLEYIMSGLRNRAVRVTPEEAKAAATAIQWLGSPVGQSFLREAGFVREEA